MKTSTLALILMLLVFGIVLGDAQGEPNTVPQPPVPSEKAAFVEDDGIVVIEMENTELPKDWSVEKTLSGYLGTGYIQYRGEDAHEKPGEFKITYPVKINKTGLYEFSWRARNGQNAEARDKENDTWVNAQADEFFGVKGDQKYSIGKHFLKAWVHSLEKWKWQAAGEMHFEVDGTSK